MVKTAIRQSAKKAAGQKRTASKEARQKQLILATIRSVAKHGLSDTTMATVSREAGLSQGIINLHFQSKDRLLVETLRYIAEEYRLAWEKAIAGAGASPADRLSALVAVDFRLPVCDRNKLAVWFAFWSESKSRPTYRKICAERDKAYRQEIVRVCGELIEAGGHDHLDAETVGACISTMTAGCWLDLLVRPRSLDREQARMICMSYLTMTFPGDFA
jgi:TetR/AcrR family transcriptional repressor of bet genes